jgi:uncharacterized membrane protein YdbT with pleckstrin-like domain
MDPQRLSPAGRQAFKLIEFDKSEKLICEIRKHPIGLAFIYIGGAFVILTLLAIAIVAAALSRSMEGREAGVNTNSLSALVIVVCLVVAVGSLVATAIAAYLYTSNVILVSTDKLAQVLNPSLFNRKISQLNINDVQDVTVTQRGILPRIFNYGTMVVETAGEQQNYTFSLIPDPYAAAKDIIAAHEQNIHQYGN